MKHILLTQLLTKNFISIDPTTIVSLQMHTEPPYTCVRTSNGDTFSVEEPLEQIAADAGIEWETAVGQ